MAILAFSSLGLLAQPVKRYNTFSYSVNEGLLQSTVGDMAFDKNNFCWISFPNGIQRFDGKNFINVPVQPGLPDNKLTYFFQCRNGDLLISHSQGISRYEINSNRFRQVYTFHAGEKTPAQFIAEDENIIYLYSETGNIIGINSQLQKTVSEIKTGFPAYASNGEYRPRFSDNIINHKIVLFIKSVLYLWDLQKGKLVSKSEPVAGIGNIFFKLKTENEVLYCNNKITNALQLYNFNSQKISTLPVKGKDDKPIGRCNIFAWQNKILLSFNNRVYETDSTLQVLKSELVNFQNQPVAGNQAIGQIKEDNFGNLYLQTVTGGIKKIIRNNYPFKYFSTAKADSNFVISILPDKKNNRILTGTAANGLLVFDTLQHLIKHIKTMPGSNLPATVNAIIKTKQGKYLLFITGEKQLWEISNDFAQIKRFTISTSLPPDKSGIEYFGNVLFQNEAEAIVQSQKKFYRTNLLNNVTTEYFITQGYIMGGIFFKKFIVTHTNDELLFLDALTGKEIKRVVFKNTGNVRCFAAPALPPGNAENDNIYIGSNKGIFIIDSAGKILQHLTKETGLPDECIYAMAFDKHGLLWCSSNKGIFKINRDNSVQQFKKEDGLQENEFNTNSVAKAEDGELFFGGVNGVSSFYPGQISGFEEKLKILVTKIKINNEEAFNDTAVWQITDIELPYDKNSLSFDFITMANNNPGQYIYQYKMEGIDKEWVQNNELQTVRYFLPPGDYVFKIYAGRSFDKDAKPMKEIRIIINPPFWKTWWFITSIILLAIATLAYSFNRYNKNKYQKKLAVLENERRIQVERERISRDLHDSIGAYANAVLYNTELLQKEIDLDEKNVLMNDLKFASKDIITSLRETVWALKKDNYTEEECLLRIKNFMQALSRYYPHIQFKVAGEASAENILHHTKALHVVRIVQEAVTNAIKHAAAKVISLSSNQQEGKWELMVGDDGTGFDYEGMKHAEAGNGLINMNQRAIESGIEFTVNSQVDSGTKVTILI